MNFINHVGIINKANTNAPVKFEGKQPMSCWDIDQKALLPIRSI
jgi:hypothetical protein